MFDEFYELGLMTQEWLFQLGFIWFQRAGIRPYSAGAAWPIQHPSINSDVLFDPSGCTASGSQLITTRVARRTSNGLFDTRGPFCFVAVKLFSGSAGALLTVGHSKAVSGRA